MQVVPYRAEHVESLILQDAQAYLQPSITPEYAKALEPTRAFSALVDGQVIGCAGLIDHWPGRATAWTLLSPAAKDHMAGVHRAVARFLSVCGVRRIEATVDVEFAAGHRWMRMLGFEMEAPFMPAYRPDGGACALYARIS